MLHRCSSGHFLKAWTWLLASFAIAFPIRAEVIYDNTSTYLGTFGTEKREYGDQLDLGGTARLLTEIAFEYYGEFSENGDEFATVRLYTNERVYDMYRKAPTTLIYESGAIPIDAGFNARYITGLSVPLPLHTVTFTIEFSGLASNEFAGLLFYSPPSIGYSFNEFWRRTENGNWQSILYSTTDPARRANAGLRLTALPEPALDQQQAKSSAMVQMHDGTNRYRYAQTFIPNVSGRLDHITFSIPRTNALLEIRIRDTIGNAPGPVTLGSVQLPNQASGSQVAQFYEQVVYLQAGTKYAIEFSTSNPVSQRSVDLAVDAEEYPRGELWRRNEADGPWKRLENQAGSWLDAVFSTHIVPAAPPVVLQGARAFRQFDFGEPIVLSATVRLPDIGEVQRVRYFNLREEIGVVTNAPYHFVWTNPPSGNVFLQAVAEDTFRRPYRSERIQASVRAIGPPLNDDFVNRIALEGSGARGIKPSLRATLEPGEPRVLTNSAGASLWWSWTAFDDHPVTFTLENGAAPNGTIGVFTGSQLSSLVQETNGIRAVTFRPRAGTRYSIGVDPPARGEEVVLDVASADVQISRLSPGSVVYEQSPVVFVPTASSGRAITNVQWLVNGTNLVETSGRPRPVTNRFAPGYYEVSLRATDSRGLQTRSDSRQLVVRPANDSWKAPRNIGPSLSGSILASTIGATRQVEDSGDPEGPGASVWYRWIVPATGPARLSVPAGTTVRVFRPGQGGGAPELVEVEREDGEIRFFASAGEEYRFVLEAEEQENLLIAYELSPQRLAIEFAPALEIRFQTVRDQVVQLESSTNLVDWIQIGDSVNGTGEMAVWNVEEIETKQFFRVRME